MLHDFHRIHSASGGHLGRTGAYYELFFPTKVRNWLYRLAIDRGHHDVLLDRFIVTPINKFAHFLHSLETKWSRFAVGSAKVGERRLAA
ncbi:MAG: hypothetical protein JNN15_05670, partial [Blastocatellia bacterium]|nr:hypothetical protein [Blastocatellia bacterium]